MPTPWAQFANPSFDLNPGYGVASYWQSWSFQGAPAFKPSAQIAHSGAGLSQSWETLSGYGINGGVRQRVVVANGMHTTFGCWVLAGNEDDQATTRYYVGIDPSGGFNQDDVVWSVPVTNPTTWTWLTVTASASGSAVTVYVRAETVDEPRGLRIFYADDALLY